ncbi:MAG TPA: SAM-dependent methyltransferase [Acidimicrobiales bacterium]|nr:SAM-dependent methyltransferase [Acidimicrobiales bacterium]
MNGDGVVHLVGAGPGDPLLLTRRAVRLLGEADVVVADRHSSDAVVALARPRAERCYVGRTPEGDAWPLHRVVDMLEAHAAAGRTVVRLKGGDVYVCSRGAEEAAALTARGVRVEATPGVTSATAAPLAAGVVPAVGARITIASGADDPGAAPVAWEELADPGSTLVVLTGRAHQRVIAQRLSAAGASGATPVAVVHAAGRPGTHVVATDLAGMGANRLPPPAAVVIGPMIGGGGAHP